VSFLKDSAVIASALFALVVIPAVNGGCKGGEARPQLEAARQNLRIGEATEERIASGLEELKRSRKATPEVLKDYEIYLSRVQDMVAENRKIVESMERAHSELAGAAKVPGSARGASSETGGGEIPEERELDAVVLLDRELNDSLAEFDEMLLRELDDIRARSAQRMKNLAEEAAVAAKRLKESGVDVRGSSEEAEPENRGEGSRAEKEEQAEEQGRGRGEHEEGGQEDSTGNGRDEKARSGAGEGYGKRADPYSGSDQDDDIVARQLREAAEKETDPELKEKLWKEYEEYKKATQ
jgi:hypothetical protein